MLNITEKYLLLIHSKKHNSIYCASALFRTNLITAIIWDMHFSNNLKISDEVVVFSGCYQQDLSLEKFVLEDVKEDKVSMEDLIKRLRSKANIIDSYITIGLVEKGFLRPSNEMFKKYDVVNSFGRLRVLSSLKTTLETKSLSNRKDILLLNLLNEGLILNELLGERMAFSGIKGRVRELTRRHIIMHGMNDYIKKINTSKALLRKMQEA